MSGELLFTIGNRLLPLLRLFQVDEGLLDLPRGRIIQVGSHYDSVMGDWISAGDDYEIFRGKSISFGYGQGPIINSPSLDLAFQNRSNNPVMSSGIDGLLKEFIRIKALLDRKSVV